jgi:hypothetical protein
MGSLAAALFTFNPYDGYVPQRQEVERQFVTEGARYVTQLEEQHPLPLQRRNTLGFIERVTFTQHVSGTSLSVSLGTPKSKLDDIHTSCCAGSFYSGY